MSTIFRNIFFLILICLGSRSFANGEDWDEKNILALIDDRAAAHNSYRTIDELLTDFPSGLKTLFTFIYDAKNRFQAAEPKFPRALVFNQKLLYTFNGKSDQLGYDTLEMISFDRDRRKFIMREIYRSSDGRLKYSEKNPQKCLTCHGADPKPIWHAYDQWPGVYASNDDVMSDKERKDYIEFLDELQRTPQSRYRQLFFRDDSEIPPYGPRDRDNFRINLLLTHLLTEMNALRVSRLLEESPRYNQFKWILPDLVHSYQRGSYFDSYDCNLPDRTDDLVGLLRRMTDEEFPGRHASDPLPHIAFRAFGLTPDQVSMQLGATSYQYANGTDMFLSVLRNALIRSLKAQDSSFDVAFRYNMSSAGYQSYDLYRYLDSLVGRTQISPSICPDLEKRSQEQFDQLLKTGLEPLPAPPNKPDLVAQLREAERIRIDSAIPSTCVYCHVLGSAPDIPFHDRALLKAALISDNARLYRRIVERSDPRNTQDMPPPSSEFPSLTQDAYAAFKQFLDSL